MKFPSVTIHAHSRAHERFQCSLADLKRMGRAINEANGLETKYRGNRSNNPLHNEGRRPSRMQALFIMGEGDREKWIVRDGAREVPLVWDPRSKTIVTVLPKTALKELHRQLKGAIREFSF